MMAHVPHNKLKTEMTTKSVDLIFNVIFSFVIFNFTLIYFILAELRRPFGPPSGAPYSYGKQKETHELIFSLLVGAYTRRRRRGEVAQYGGHTPNNELTETCSLGLLCTSLILDINVMIN